MSEWFYQRAGETCGPVAPNELRRLLTAGDVTLDTHVWCPAANVAPAPLRATPFADAAPPSATPAWHYDRGGTRVGPIDETEFSRLIAAGTITRDTLVWSPGLGPDFKRLGDTAHAPPTTTPPPLPAAAVDDTLAWVLVAIPIVSAIIGRITDWNRTAPWWGIGVLVAVLAIGSRDELRLVRSGAVPRSSNLRPWVWLIPVYLFKRARALRGPKLYFWAWIASFVLSFAVDGNNLIGLLRGDTYLGGGVPTCDSSYEAGQVRHTFDTIPVFRSAGVTAINIRNARELGLSGKTRTCAAQIDASNAESYRAVFTIERTDDQILTNLQIGQ